MDKDWYAQWKAKRKIPYKEDGLDFPNSREENLEPDQHELLDNSSRTIDREAEETTIATIKISENLDTLDIELSNEDSSGSNDTATSSESVPEFREETTKQDDLGVDVELEGNSQFEMIGESATATPNLFDDPILKRVPKSRERAPKKYIPPMDKLGKMFRGFKYSDPIRSEEQVDNRPKRSVKEPKFTRREKLDDDGEVVLEWDPSDEEMVTFKVTAKTLGYVGIGFNEKDHMKGADILLAWVDDHTGTVNLLVSPPAVRSRSRSPMIDEGPVAEVFVSVIDRRGTVVGRKDSAILLTL